jgi:hypothetical protein
MLNHEDTCSNYAKLFATPTLAPTQGKAALAAETPGTPERLRRAIQARQEAGVTKAAPNWWFHPAATLVAAGGDDTGTALATARVCRKMADSYVLLMSLAFLGVVCQIVEAELVFLAGNVETEAAFKLKAVVSASTALLMYLMYVHYLDMLLLGKMKQDYHPTDTLRSTGLLQQCMLELAVCAVHCPPGWSAQLGTSSHGAVLHYTPDAWASVLICCRCYLMLRFLHNRTGHASGLAIAVGRISSVNFTPWHTVRVMLSERGLAVLSAVSMLLVALHSHALFVAERGGG